MKRINTRSKGLRSQRRVKEWLLNEYKVELVYIISHSRWQKDLFNLWDGFFIKDSEVVFIQIKTNHKPNLDIYRKWYKKYRINYLIIVVYDRKGIKIFQ